MSVFTIVPIGRTGAGKSFLGNKLCKQARFRSVEKQGSETCICDPVVFRLGEFEARYVDTPGTEDAGRNPLEAMKAFAEFHNHCPEGVDCFLYIWNGRFDEIHHRTLCWLESLYGCDIFANMFLVCSKTENDTATSLQLSTNAENFQHWVAKCNKRYYCLRSESVDKQNFAVDLSALIDALTEHSYSHAVRCGKEALKSASDDVIELIDEFQGLKDKFENEENPQAKEHFKRQLDRARKQMSLWRDNKITLHDALQGCSALHILAELQQIVDRRYRRRTLVVWLFGVVVLPLLPDLLQLAIMHGSNFEVWWEDHVEVWEDLPGSVLSLHLPHPEGPSEAQKYCGQLFGLLFFSALTGCLGKKFFQSNGFTKGLWLGLEGNSIGLCCSSLMNCALGMAQENPTALVSSAALIVVMLLIKLLVVVYQVYLADGAANKVRDGLGGSGWYKFVLLSPACAVFFLDRKLGQHDSDFSHENTEGLAVTAEPEAVAEALASDRKLGQHDSDCSHENTEGLAVTAEPEAAAEALASSLEAKEATPRPSWSTADSLHGCTQGLQPQPQMMGCASDAGSARNADTVSTDSAPFQPPPLPAPAGPHPAGTAEGVEQQETPI